jgi:hypothetical protein
MFTLVGLVQLARELLVDSTGVAPQEATTTMKDRAVEQPTSEPQ